MLSSSSRSQQPGDGGRRGGDTAVSAADTGTKTETETAVASAASTPITTIPQQLIALQCDMMGCRHRLETWTAWADANLPGLWAQSGGCALDFVKRAHGFFTETSGVEFKDWRWNFMAAIDGSPETGCNCCCGTNMVLSCAEYVGLFPGDVMAMAGPQHVWVRARRKSDGQWFFLETTLRPGDSNWCISQSDGRDKNIYGRGAWFAYTNAKLVVQEAFINQLLLTPSGSAMRTHLYGMIESEANQSSSCDNWIFDFRKLRVRQLTSRHATPSAEQQRIVASIVDTVRSSDWPPEAYMKSLLFAVKWYTWVELVHGHRRDDASLLVLLRGLSVQRQAAHRMCDEMRENLRQGRWTLECPPLRRMWASIRQYMSAWHVVFARNDQYNYKL
jgi:hypothetical protein